MASSIALRRVATGRGLFSGNLLRPLRFQLSATRWLNTNTQMTRVEDDVDRGGDRSDRTAISRRRDFPGFFSDVFDPFAPTRSVGELMNLMDQFIGSNPLTRGTGATATTRRGWDVKEDENALYLKVDMPGLGKEDVKVFMEENTLIIKGEGAKESEEEDNQRRYSTRIELTPNAYKIDEIKAEMKNGVLKVRVPKLKEDERKNVLEVPVE